MKNERLLAFDARDDVTAAPLAGSTAVCILYKSPKDEDTDVFRFSWALHAFKVPLPHRVKLHIVTGHHARS